MIEILSLSNLISLSIGFLTIIFIIYKHIKNRAKQNRKVFFEKLNISNHNLRPIILGFFHPYCNAGGGGERVLWTAIRSIQKKYQNVICVVYTGDTDATKDVILEKVMLRFRIKLDPESLFFVFLNKRNWVEDDRYPRFTLLGQSLGSTVLGFEALKKLTPDFYFDTMGYAFTYPLAKRIFGCKVGAYVHYPTISSDMLSKVQEMRPGFNNDQIITKSRILSTGKIMCGFKKQFSKSNIFEFVKTYLCIINRYYRMFAYLYSLAGSFADVVMVNSTWTKGHIDHLWGVNSKIVYPPCDTTSLTKLPLEGRQRIITSVAQFRPEKDHQLQLQSLSCLLSNYPNFRQGSEKVELILIGGSRNKSDEDRIQKLKEQCKQLNIEDNVIFEINASFEKLADWLSKSKIGLHTMWNEHFGIGVVEYMAAGLIPVAHNSGGPKMDIVIPYNDNVTGYLASTPEEFAIKLANVFSLSEEEYNNMQTNARESVTGKFSEEYLL
ncbi:glycosyltransferase family 4 protein [Glomus cerebriforme]|uniref:GDP-Man:Man(3)GlcNAc(2)-PP-Dol alpha-1,2-mannosyltransferase n=1 Tax=Glomus cerebriforme TaxID=658196 RepID=A0A397TE99_9GLOM|nr:glycosyltransferase family 4 protein [Glomus cerebriforme]